MPPTSHELEISVFGTGYGESIVLHLGLNRWAIVDSCRNFRTKRPVALEYLSDLGVDVANHVVMVAATHWDKDHTSGLAEIFQRAESALFVCSPAVNTREFDNLLATVAGTTQLAPPSGIDEMRAILIELSRRKADEKHVCPKIASAGKTLLNLSDSPAVIIKALSPSDAGFVAAVAQLRSVPVPTEGTAKRRPPKINTNDASVVISVGVGQGELLLLGADLEERGSPNLGWQAVVRDWPLSNGKHKVFKVPHHGSSNSHLNEVWENMLVRDATCIVTSFVHGNSIVPERQDCERLASLTKHAFLTTHPSRGKFKTQNRAISRITQDYTRSFCELGSKFGHVRVRRDLRGPPEWVCSRFGAALPINTSFIASLG